MNIKQPTIREEILEMRIQGKMLSNLAIPALREHFGEDFEILSSIIKLLIF